MKTEVRDEYYRLADLFGTRGPGVMLETTAAELVQLRAALKALHALWEIACPPGATMDSPHLPSSLKKWLKNGGAAALSGEEEE